MAGICGPVIQQLMGGDPAAKASAYRLASPADHLPLGIRHLLVGALFAPQMRAYADAAAARGDEIRLLEPPRATHVDIINPATPNGTAVLDFILANAFSRPGSPPRSHSVP